MRKARQNIQLNRSYAGKTLRLYWQHVRHHKKLFWPLAVTLPLALLLTSYLSAWIVAQVINRLTTQGVEADSLWQVFGPWVIGYISILIVGELVLWRLVMYWYWKLETKVIYRLNRSSFETLASQSMDFHNNRFGGSLVSQVNKFSRGYAGVMDAVFFNLVPLVSAFIYTFVILGPQMPLFAGGLAVLSAVFMLIAVLSFRSISHLNVIEADSQNKLSGQLSDSVTNIMAIKSHGSEQLEQERYDAINQQAQQASLNVVTAVMRRDIGFGSVIVLMSSLAFIFLVGGNAWFGTPIGTLGLAITYTGLVLGQLWNFNGILRKLNQSFGDAQEMTKILTSAKTVTDKPDAPDLRVMIGDIRLKDVTFHHSDVDESQALFKNFNLDIKPGEQVGLVGTSGSGKTTLTKLILRFADINSGAILIDGQNIADVTQASLRHSIAYVPQEPMLFHRSLRDNIAYSRPDATDREVEEAARKANALEFIEKLPYGFHTEVGERGVKLSGGQRQRIAIARAILKDAPILILDEATSALDSQSERLIQEALVKLMEGRTSIVIAHRLSTISQLDRVVVLDNGTVVEDGNHETLLKRRGVYAKLWAHQSGGFIEE